jgi:hypothetical protein
MVEEGDNNEEKIKELWKGIKSRGIKQRLKKKVEQKFNIVLEKKRISVEENSS